MAHFESLPFGCFPGDDNITQEFRHCPGSLALDLGERQDVRGAVNGAVLPVQVPYLPIICDEDAELRLTPVRVS